MFFCEQKEFAGWQRSHHIGNNYLEMSVVSEIGPRILHLSLKGSHNLFRNIPDDLGQTGGSEFRLYGGQRLWAAPENSQDTYFPDNRPADFQRVGDAVFEVAAPVEETTGLQKVLRIEISPDAPRVAVEHMIFNRGSSSREYAPWALSVMNLHGIAIAPLPPYGSHEENLEPACPLALWSYTDLTDPRWTIGNRYVLLRQDPIAGHPQKLGLQVQQGWAAYWLDGVLFVKTFPFSEGSSYPDFGSNVELYTDNRIIEVESLGSLSTVPPGGCLTHTEVWHLFSGVPAPDDDVSVDAHVMPHVLTAISP